MGKGVIWYDDRIRAITDTIPEKAHALAASEAAGIGAKKIQSSYTGTLARDVATVKEIGPMHRAAGSNQPQALIENFGGTIRPKSGGRLLIRGRGGASGTGRTTTGGPIVASAQSVQHKGKHYLEAIREAFPGRFIDHLRRLMS